ncbi:MAG: hypothetical protein LKE53_06480 [Oscillospiraceae bacterium]|jgi:hypothetical protein|nr:hypothetical protein [Oscillospiraceae bacterium]
MSKNRRYIYLTDDEYEFLQGFKSEKGVPYLSDAVSALVADYRVLQEKQKETEQLLKICRASARDAHLCLLMLSSGSRSWEHQLFIPEDSKVLAEAKKFYESELQAARTKKSNADS